MAINDSEFQQLIESRRTCYSFASKQSMPVGDNDIEQCLNAALWAPNHKLTQPWRFWVLGASSQSELAKEYAQLRADKREQAGTQANQEIYSSAVDKFLEIPRIVLVGQKLNDDPATAKEDYAACACAIQNFQLVAWQKGIGVQWSTGPILQSELTYQLLGISADEIELIGALYIGHLPSDYINPITKRKPVSEVTEWLS